MDKVRLTSEQKVILKKARIWAEVFFKKAKNEKRLVVGGHGFDHNQRVAGMASTISLMEDRDPFLPILTSLIFDIGRASADPRSRNWHHGQLSREIADNFIDSLPLLGKNDKLLVKNAIEDHPKLNENVRRSYVVEIVMDADRLDTLGALAPVRVAAHRWKLPLFSLEASISTKDSEIKTIYQDFALRSKEFYDMLWTKSARRIAKPKLTFMVKFIKEFRNEASFAHKAFDDLDI